MCNETHIGCFGLTVDQVELFSIAKTLVKYTLFNFLKSFSTKLNKLNILNTCMRIANMTIAARSSMANIFAIYQVQNQ